MNNSNHRTSTLRSCFPLLLRAELERNVWFSRDLGEKWQKQSEAFLEVNLCKQFSLSGWPDGEFKPRRRSVYPELLFCPSTRRTASGSELRGCVFLPRAETWTQKGLFNREGTRRTGNPLGWRERIFSVDFWNEQIFRSDFKEPESWWNLEYVRLSLKSDNNPLVLKCLLHLLF